MRTLKSKVGLGSIAAGAALVMAAATAFACTNLAELNLSSSSGRAGTQLTVTGSAFAKAPKNTPVDLHWNGVNGPVLATVTPDAAGAIGPLPLTIPADAAPGYYVVVATQTEIATGLNPWGLPTRAGFQVLGPGDTPAGVPAAVSTGANSGSGVSGGFVALSIALGVSGLLLFGFGAATFVSSARRRVPTPSRVRP
ncbi:MAG TPA: hypothetical protein VL337_13370 [Acidimicrobiales bacterium]|jgi:hypothetical protein|nr:hypothetical protein [Acidimicrobiales bacterium]